MALIVETGAGVAGADSYVSLVDAQSFLDARGFEVTLDEGLLLRAMDALVDVQWRGNKTLNENPLAWPRYGVIDRESHQVAFDAVPSGITHAQIWLAYYIGQGVDPAARAESRISRERVDVIDTSYSTRAGSKDIVSVLSIPNVRNSLRDYMAVGGRLHHA